MRTILSILCMLTPVLCGCYTLHDKQKYVQPEAVQLPTTTYESNGSFVYAPQPPEPIE